MNTKKRKGEHVNICVKKNVSYAKNWFDDIRFVHNALTDLNYDDIDCSAIFINHHLKYPFMITGMTGGYKGAEKINKAIAKMCEKYEIAFGLGSQRAMVEDEKLKETYYVRDVAKNIPVVGNIGAAQLFEYDSDKINNMLKDTEVDYLAVHLNTLQELVQLEGDVNFSGLANTITSKCREIEFPIIIKETGAGINIDVVKKLNKCKSYIKGFDVAGTGGTSWSKVEEFRGGDSGPFNEWGNPTPVCVAEVCGEGAFTIASGGIRNGLDAAKAFALGADICGMARPFIKAYYKKQLDSLIEQFIKYLKRAMMLTNSQNLEELLYANIVITGELAEHMFARGIDVRMYANKK